MLAIIQARLGSKRLKDKVLKLINRKPLIWYVINQVKKSKYIKNLIIAIPNNRANDRLNNYLKDEGFVVYRGSENNVAHRMLKAAESINAKYFLRICADSPLIDEKIIDKMIEIKKKIYKIDIVTNVFPRTFASGQSVEIIKTKTLKQNLKNMNNSQLEHVTKFFYENHEKFKILNIKNKNKKRRRKCSVDTLNDFKKIRKLVK